MTSDYNKMANKLKLFGDPTRLMLLGLLKTGESCVCDLVEFLQISQPGVSQHLRKLKKENIILERREGTWIYYRLNLEQEDYILRIIESIPSITVNSSGCSYSDK